MSIVLKRGNRIGGGAEFIRGISGFPIYDSPEVSLIQPEGPRFGPPSSPPAADGTAKLSGYSSCSSSIGRNSDRSAAEGEDSGEAEVQSTYKGPLDTMDALEDSLPIRQGISKFYRGKSKSFTSLMDSVPSSSSVKDLAKPENPYNRKRKILLAFSTMWDRTSPYNKLSRSADGCIYKRRINSSRSTLAPSACTSSSGSDSNSSEGEHNPVQLLLPPLHPESKLTTAAAAAPFNSSPKKRFPFSVRSFSLTDMQEVAISNSSVGPRITT